MAHVQVVIAGRSYRMACEDGEEGHLQVLAAAFDGKIGELRNAFGEIGDMRLHVMAALTVADELSEARRRLDALEVELAATRSVLETDRERSGVADRAVAEALNRTAERIERLARTLSGTGQELEDG